MIDRYERQARNEALVREVNERIAEVDKAAEEKNFGFDGTRYEFLCECGADDREAAACEERVYMRIDEYEQVRSQDDRFVVYPGHETEAIEWVAVRTDRFVIVDKRPAVEPLVADDPRDAPSH